MATRFRLATLLRLRERERDQAAMAVQEVYTAIERLKEAESEIRESNASMDNVRKQSSNGMIAIRQILDAQRYQMVLDAQSAQIADHMSKLDQELQRRQFALLRCQQSVKSLEKLRDQRKITEEKDELARQQDRLDEWSSIRFALKAKESFESDMYVEVDDEETR